VFRAHRGPLELVLFLPREQRRARFAIAETVDGWCLASETGTADDGTSRRLVAPEIERLIDELDRVVRAMLASGYTIEQLRLADPTPAA
jgi:hypothetical protein